jgi:iron complex transport system substrate-binding protein
LRPRWCSRITALALALAAAGSAIATDAPRRVVSLNPCVDAILVEIAPREQIAALSFRSRDPGQSVLHEIAKTYPITYETAEEVVALRPDLVLATKHSALATRNALRRVGIRTVVFDVPESIDDSFAQIKNVAIAIGRESAGQALIARLQADLRVARGNLEIPALIFQPSGFTPGADTLIGELMQVVGFKNIAARYGIERWGVVDLEQIIADPPRMLLIGEVTPGAPTWAERKVQHRALRYLTEARSLRVNATTCASLAGCTREPLQMLRATVPARLLYCGGPVMEQALQSLVAAREQLGAAR